MQCKRCGQSDHKNANSVSCPKSLINQKISTWDGSKLVDCIITAAVIAGIIDADGHAGFMIDDGIPRFRVAIFQSHQFGLDVLDLIRLWMQCGTLTGPRRNSCYALYFSSKTDSDKVYDIMMEHGVIKGGLRKRIYNITDPWLGGFFAGDGCARRTRDNSPIVKISQKQHPDILYAIKAYLGYGTVAGNEEDWWCCGENARMFALRFADYALHKREDLLKLLE